VSARNESAEREYLKARLATSEAKLAVAKNDDKFDQYAIGQLLWQISVMHPSVSIVEILTRTFIANADRLVSYVPEGDSIGIVVDGDVKRALAFLFLRYGMTWDRYVAALRHYQENEDHQAYRNARNRIAGDNTGGFNPIDGLFMEARNNPALAFAGPAVPPPRVARAQPENRPDQDPLIVPEARNNGALGIPRPAVPPPMVAREDPPLAVLLNDNRPDQDPKAIPATNPIPDMNAKMPAAAVSKATEPILNMDTKMPAASVSQATKPIPDMDTKTPAATGKRGTAVEITLAVSQLKPVKRSRGEPFHVNAFAASADLDSSVDAPPSPSSDDSE
jgi:hypothetical protein